MIVEIRALQRSDDRSRFQSGDAALDLFFARYAGQNQFRHHIGVTYVAVAGNDILGFVTVSPAILDADNLPGGRTMPPYPMPVLRIARLAVAAAAGRRGIGEALFRYCVELAERMRDDFGCVGLLVDAKPTAVPFYRRFGFVEMETSEGATLARPAPTVMYLPLGAVPARRPPSA